MFYFITYAFMPFLNNLLFADILGYTTRSGIRTSARAILVRTDGNVLGLHCVSRRL